MESETVRNYPREESDEETAAKLVAVIADRLSLRSILFRIFEYFEFFVFLYYFERKDIDPVACVRRPRTQQIETKPNNFKFKTPARLPSGTSKTDRELWAVARFIELLKSGKSSDYYDAYLGKRAGAEGERDLMS